MENSAKNDSIGFVTTGSTATNINVMSWGDTLDTPLMGKLVYVDLQSGQDTYRGLGTITDMLTTNSTLSNPAIAVSTSNNGTMTDTFSKQDLKTFSIHLQATYRKQPNENQWVQAGNAFPFSPSTGTRVTLITQHVIDEMLTAHANSIVHLGHLRGGGNDENGMLSPMLIPGFQTRRGATHTAILGRSGVGKTGFASTLLFAQMRNNAHAMIVIDPQGQWSSENGFLFSLQKAASALGRSVNILRVSEDIRLPLKLDLMTFLFNETRVWNSLQRMGDENKKILSEEAAKIIIRTMRGSEQSADTPPQEFVRHILEVMFHKIGASNSIINRIYARGSDQATNLQNLCQALSGDNYNADDDYGTELFSKDEIAETWTSLTATFTPLLNLFAKYNLNGKQRYPLSGPNSFMADALRARPATEIAPYLLLDMSSDVRLNERTSYARMVSQSSTLETYNPVENMRAMLDNQEIKAHIVSTILDEIKTRAEQAYVNGEGNLDTQVIFDEAWRYAPKPNQVPSGSAIHQLSEKLAGFALDTRKYGIGWTYILQAPTDLNETIWRQLTFVYAGHGMIGADRRLLNEIMDDNRYMSLYDQFASPQSTGIYPFMALGPVNPLIFTSAPTFFNVFNTVEGMLDANKRWIKDYCATNGLPNFSKNPDLLSIGSPLGDSVAPSASAPRRRIPTKSVPRRNRPPVPSPTGISIDGETLIQPPPF